MKIGRSNSREYDPEYRNRRLFHRRAHSRNNSHDLDFDSRHKRPPTHSRTSSRDEPTIKYILNCLKPDERTNRLLMSSAALMATAAAAEHGAARAVRKHCRNHSYDQIYSMPIKMDQELHNKFNRHRTLAATTSVPIGTDNEQNATKSTNLSNLNANKEYLDNRMLSKIEMPQSTNIPMSSHSRTNSKDLNKSNFLSSLVDDAANILRHRRTNSKDLNRILNPMPSTSEMGPLAVNEPTTPSQTTQSQYHKRNVSLPRNDLPEEENANDVANVLLLGNNEHSDKQLNRRDDE